MPGTGDAASPAAWEALLTATIVAFLSPWSFSTVVVFLDLVSSLVKTKLENKINVSN